MRLASGAISLDILHFFVRVLVTCGVRRLKRAASVIPEVYARHSRADVADSHHQTRKADGETTDHRAKRQLSIVDSHAKAGSRPDPSIYVSRCYFAGNRLDGIFRVDMSASMFDVPAAVAFSASPCRRPP